MKSLPLLLSTFYLFAGSLGQAKIEPPEGFVSLYNGKNLDGWWGLKTEDPAKWMALSPEDFAKKKKASLEDIKKHWTAKGDILHNDGHGLYLTTEKYYGDFELLVDYKTVAKADSGIYLRGIPQVQIWDYTKEGGKWKIGADKGSGGLWNNSKGKPGKDPLVLADNPIGEWNSFRIRMVGENVTIHLNDKLVVDNVRLENYFNRKGPLPEKGPIQLQTHGGEISWRNIFIKELGKSTKGKKKSAGGFKKVFNGKDFEGWSGPLANYQIVDGAIQCKKGKGGTIFTKESYEDFVVQFEFKLPPGGNNGLALRYPGKGDTAYVGMCELQVLDNTAKKYAKLHPAQYHGSAYGMFPAKRGFLKKPGEWNHQEVTVHGHSIKVVLNGETILDCDLSKPGKTMAPIEKYKGRLRTEGHFGFAGHSDPVSFRNVRIKRL